MLGRNRGDGDVGQGLGRDAAQTHDDRPGAVGGRGLGGGWQVERVRLREGVDAHQVHARVGGDGGEDLAESTAGTTGVDRVGLVGQRRQQVLERGLRGVRQRRDGDAAVAQSVDVQQPRAGDSTGGAAGLLGPDGYPQARADGGGRVSLLACVSSPGPAAGTILAPGLTATMEHRCCSDNNDVPSWLLLPRAGGGFR